MSGRRTGTRSQGQGKSKGKGKAKASSAHVVPDVYQELLSETLPGLSDASERPLKRRKVGQRATGGLAVTALDAVKFDQNDADDDDDDDVEFEDVLHPAISGSGNSELPKKQQTAYREADEESDESDVDWEPIHFDLNPNNEEPRGDLELTLTSNNTPRRPTAPRRKALTNDERSLRLQIHKMHVLCLLAYLERRNDWCNDEEVQKSLRPILSKKTVNFMNPKSDLSQFGQTNSLKRGLAEAADVWREKFKVTERGMRRSLWADNESDLQNVSKFTTQIMATVLTSA
jgi:xeroderma pigmentosum group C-complementing protein